MSSLALIFLRWVSTVFTEIKSRSAISRLLLPRAMKESISEDKVTAWGLALINKENNADWKYTSLPIQMNGERTKLDIKIIPQKEEYGLPSYHTQIQFPRRKSFYVGVGMSFYGALFRSEGCSVEGIQIDSVTANYRIKDEGYKKGEVGVTTLIHFGWKPFVKEHPKNHFVLM